MPAAIGQLGVFAAQYVNKCKHGYHVTLSAFPEEVVL